LGAGDGRAVGTGVFGEVLIQLDEVLVLVGFEALVA